MSDFWKRICAWKGFWQALFVLSAIILILVLFSVVFTPEGSAAFYVNQFNILFLVPTTLGTLYVLVRCRQEKR